MENTIKRETDSIRNQVGQLSLCVYNTQNITRALFNGLDKDGNVSISTHDYISLIDLITELKTKYTVPYTSPLYARYNYRIFLSMLKTFCNIPRENSLVFSMNGLEVGSIIKGKVMGSYLPYQQIEGKADSKLYLDLVKEVTEDKCEIKLDPVKFFQEQVPGTNMTLRETYIACKAGDALLAIWTDLMISRGVKMGDTLNVIDMHLRTIYRFRYERPNGVPGTLAEPDYVDRYELHPKMQFNEYYMCF